MYTLKIKWARYARIETVVGVADETTLFIAADEIRVHGHIEAGRREDVMKHWHDQADGPGYMNYLSEHADGQEMAGRLVVVIRGGVETWYTASHAWVLGPNGDTIESIAP